MSLVGSVEAYRCALLRPLITATTVACERVGFWLQLRWPGVAVGLGEAAGWPHFGSGQEQVAAWQPSIKKALEQSASAMAPPPSGAIDGQDAQNIDRLEMLRWVAEGRKQLLLACRQAGAETSHAGDVPPEWQHALETALLAAAGERCGLPMAALLTDEPAREILSHVQVTSAIEAADAARAGARSFKVKVTGRLGLDDECARLAGIRAAIGDEAELRLDANGIYAFEEARRAVRLFALVRPAWLEQPLSAADLAGAAALRQVSPVPLALDEALGGPAAIERALALRAADVYVLKPMFTGGPTPTLAAATQILAAGCDVQLTHAIESPIGCAAALQLAAALPTRGAQLAGGGAVRHHGLAAMLGPPQPPRSALATWVSQVAANGLGPRMAVPQGSGLGLAAAMPCHL